MKSLLFIAKDIFNVSLKSHCIQKNTTLKLNKQPTKVNRKKLKKKKNLKKLVSGRLLYNSSTTNNRDLHHETAQIYSAQSMETQEKIKDMDGLTLA